VDIDGARVQEALDASGMTLAELVRQVGGTRQALYFVLRGTTAQCRQSRRTAIAQALGVSSEEWLAGGESAPMDWLVGQLKGTSRGHRAINRLGRRCQKAFERDAGPPNATGLLLRFTLPSIWRGLFLEPDLPSNLYECEDLPEAERDRLKLALVKVLEVILQPWLTGQAKFDYRALGRLTVLADSKE